MWGIVSNYQSSFGTKMTTQTLLQTEQKIASLLLKWLKQHQTPVSLQVLKLEFGSQTGLSHRTIKETIWKLVEEGKIKFTSSWELDIC